jgi:hypothetical protein
MLYNLIRLIGILFTRFWVCFYKNVLYYVQATQSDHRMLLNGKFREISQNNFAVLQMIVHKLNNSGKSNIKLKGVIDTFKK